MAGFTVSGDTITVHGRGSLNIPYTLDQGDANKTLIDLSTRTLFFEIDGAALRVPLVADPGEPKGKRIVLTRTNVEKLSKTPMKFALVDETNIASDLPDVLWDGTISRTAYVGAPDLKVDD